MTFYLGHFQIKFTQADIAFTQADIKFTQAYIVFTQAGLTEMKPKPPVDQLAFGKIFTGQFLLPKEYVFVFPFLNISLYYFHLGRPYADHRLECRERLGISQD